jgi:FKBP-type peptidyl-prolyl cis-trans isomerase
MLSLLPGCASAPPGEATGEFFAPELQVDQSQMTNRNGVLFRDFVIGEGAEVRRGREVAVHYRLFLPDGSELESVVPPEPAVRFTVGENQVIQGWERGIVGMRTGGRRQLIVTARLAYGARGSGKVPPNATLVFFIDLVRLR